MNSPIYPTPEEIEALIQHEHYFSAGDGVFGATGDELEDRVVQERLDMLTFCVLLLKNGTTVVGGTTCIEPDRFTRTEAHAAARNNAIEHLLPMLMYERMSKNHAN